MIPVTDVLRSPVYVLLLPGQSFVFFFVGECCDKEGAVFLFGTLCFVAVVVVLLLVMRKNGRGTLTVKTFATLNVRNTTSVSHFGGVTTFLLFNNYQKTKQTKTKKQ